MILNNMGIQSNLRKSGQHKDVPYYDLVISNDECSLREFQQSIDFVVHHKKENLKKIIERSSTRNYQNNLIPDFTKILKKDGSRKKLTGKDGSWGKSFSQNEFSALTNLSEETQQIISDIRDENVVFSQIKSIESCLVKSIDITVKNEECYVGNGFVHHNSRGLYKQLFGSYKKACEECGVKPMFYANLPQEFHHDYRHTFDSSSSMNPFSSNICWFTLLNFLCNF